MLANQNMQIEAMQATHRHVESVLALLAKACGNLGAADVATECDQLRRVLQDTDSMFQTLRDSSTGDLSSVLNDVKKYSSDIIASESRELQATLKKHSSTAEADINERFKKLESRVLSELASGGGEPGDSSGASRSPGKAGDGQVLKKVTSRMNDFESQVSGQLQVMAQDIEKKMAFLASAPRSPRGGGAEGAKSAALETYASDLDAIKYDIGELKDLMAGAKGDTAHVKRIVLACERDMEDFTAAMDAVNVDLDEMRARVDSTHSIITSRQRVEATVTAEISTMRLDMGDMQEALKAHDAWMEDVSQSLQEAHERCGSLSEDIGEQRAQTQAKLDAKTDITSWNDTNDDVDASIKTVRDMASALRLEVDSRRRKVDDSLGQMRGELQQLSGRVDGHKDEQRKFLDDAHSQIYAKIEERAEHCRALEEITGRHMEVHRQLTSKMDSNQAACQAGLAKLEGDLGRQDEEMSKEVNDRVDALERHHANVAKESAKRLGALDLRISGLQGASGESKRDVSRLREEVNSLTVKSAAHDMDIGKSCDDLRKLERHRAEDSQRAKQDVDAVYEELDQKVYEKSFQSLEDNVTKLTRGVVKLSQVLGVFPGARMNDGTDEELDVDVELLNWEDCAQNLTARVEKTWRQVSSQKYRSVLDLVSKKADHSVLRLLQISQQHIESQLDRVRSERELWKEVLDKRQQQPLQLALTMKDPITGQPLPGAGGLGGLGGCMPGGLPPHMYGAPAPRPLGGDGCMPGGLGGGLPGGLQCGMGGVQPELMSQTAPTVSTAGAMAPPPALEQQAQAAPAKASPLAKRIARPPQAAQPQTAR